MTKRTPRATWLCFLALGACSSGHDDAAGADDGGRPSSGAGSANTAGTTGSEAPDAGHGGSAVVACGTAAGGSAGRTASEPTFQCSELPGTCGECIAEKCCELAELCSADADCACMAMCIGAQSLTGVESCLDSCGVDGSPLGFAELATCVAPTCPDSDECSAPAGFAPPADVEPSGQSSSTELGSGTLADCSFDAGLAYDPDGAILQLESADGSLCARIERRDDGMGDMANTRFTLISILVGPLGEVVQLDDPADVCWYSSHHNFNDWAHAWSGSRHYDLKMARADHGVAPTYSLQVFEQGPLEGASCPAFAEGSCQIGDTIELFPVMP